MNPIYILGSGAVGMPLAVFLTNAGRSVIAVRTSTRDVGRQTMTVTVAGGESTVSASVEMVSLAKLEKLDGMIVITAKAHANTAIAAELRARDASGPVVVLQNGLGVEQPFIESGFSPVYRCVLYVTSQAVSEYAYSFRPVTASPVGVARGDASGLGSCVGQLSTSGFPFRPESDIAREVWKKAIINCVFNSICPLLDADNGIFVRDSEVKMLAGEVVGECLAVAERRGIQLGTDEIMSQIERISRTSDGQLISTLQDIRAGRQTEIVFLNLEIARVAASLQPPVPVPRTEMLGRMIVAKSVKQAP